jgi:hypothetical protein
MVDENSERKKKVTYVYACSALEQGRFPLILSRFHFPPGMFQLQKSSQA